MPKKDNQVSLSVNLTKYNRFTDNNKKLSYLYTQYNLSHQKVSDLLGVSRSVVIKWSAGTDTKNKRELPDSRLDFLLLKLVFRELMEQIDNEDISEAVITVLQHKVTKKILEIS